MTQKYWYQSKSKEEVRKIMSERGKQFVEKKRLAFETLKRVNEIKAKWKKMTKVEKSLIANGLFS